MTEAFALHSAEDCVCVCVCVCKAQASSQSDMAVGAGVRIGQGVRMCGDCVFGREVVTVRLEERSRGKSGRAQKHSELCH